MAKTPPRAEPQSGDAHSKRPFCSHPAFFCFCFEMIKSNCEGVTCVILTIRIFHCNAFRWTKYIYFSFSIFHWFANVMCYVMKTHLLILWFPLGNIVHSEGVISSTFPDELSALHSVHSRGCPSTGRLSAASRQTSAGRCALTSPLHYGNGNSPPVAWKLAPGC